MNYNLKLKGIHLHPIGGELNPPLTSN